MFDEIIFGVLVGVFLERLTLHQWTKEGACLLGDERLHPMTIPRSKQNKRLALSLLDGQPFPAWLLLD